MQDTSRVFAYMTWVIMISLGIILTTNPFLSYVNDPSYIGLLALLGFGFIYLNFTYAVIKRFIKKVPAPTNMHYGLAVAIFLPAAIWIFTISEQASGAELILISILAFSCGLGAFYGNRAGIKARYEYIQTLKAAQDESKSERTDQK